ncbi:helix-turn-helix transcriptional regulator [Flexivirga alba]|uniref:Helix-turn-helix transcriptional regulator n=1 Tax=Flexivirga alba TaxID=702742 RepID=A0ABW2AGX2_9MICO
MEAIPGAGDRVRTIDLSAVGLTSEHEADYRSLIEQGGGTAGVLAVRWHRTVPDVEARLAALHELGLVEAVQVAARTVRWFPASPDVGLRALLNSRQHALARAETSVAALAELFRRDLNHAEVGDLVEVVLGADAVGAQFLQLQRSARTEVCAFVDARPVAVESGNNAAEAEALDRGVAFRVVLERAALEDDATANESRESLGAHVQLRTVEKVPTKLLIADRGVAMVPLAVRSHDAAAVLIKAPSLVQALVTLFDSVWSGGIPIVLDPQHGPIEGPGAGPDSVDLALVSLMLAGLTDDAVGKRLGISGRTVQRRLKLLMQLTGSTSRMQLGWEAAQRGWVTRR